MMRFDTPRAARLPLRISVTYRVPGHEEWLYSQVDNISESGVLFGPTTLTPGTPVEVIVFSPVRIGSLAPGKLRCIGEVVRATEAGHVGTQFEECRFLLEES
jgi:hypothetical protein